MVENGVPSAPTEGLPAGFLAPGQVLGDRYQIRSQLGRGGMGEVWRAFDLKLRVEVALKAMLPDLFKTEKRRDLLRREVRAAREVVSPNVCRIFDLIEVDGRELVSMEYVDGGTLLSLLAERGPLDLKEAQDIASQFLAGLEAIHQAGLVHRDVKPENIMITRAGRVVLMDFGLARQEDSGAGTVSGTPAYMAPEQAMGGKVDARADVYSAGVVLAEMVSPDGIKNLESRQSVWEGIRQEPARVPDSPWAPVLKKAVAKEPEQRYNSAHTLTRALEDVTLRVEGAEDLTPYPGLASFSEEDAEYFFGREAEVEQMWRKLEGPARLLAIAGPSGAGKTSFLRAGLVPNSPPGWTIIRCTPGNAPMNALAGALASETAGDPEAVKMLLRFHEREVAVDIVSRWRRRHEHAILIVDQFEELFTLNPPEVQRQVASLLGQLVLEADIVVLLSLRDDYLFRCHQSESLRPSLADLTMLGPPEGPALRRALVQPATKCGYRFEDDELVEEMYAEVESERGALPMLAFAAARLWEKRDRENGLLTRQAHKDIGGVGGALARHAEATIDRIGVERLPVVREIFRNLVTAEGTRAVREWDELLSVFSDSQGESPEEPLGALIGARLLTSYEVREEEEEPTRMVEIIHESLLANWPRLVGWQTQDADSARLRDELRQAARTWDEHDRSDDLLWTGSAYREFTVWRDRYPGGLSDVEEAFAEAMMSLARRSQRRRRIAVGAAFGVLLAGLVVVGYFWQRSVREARRADAANLVSLGQLELESNPSASVAHAIASLELADGPGVRLLALKALWKGPTAFVVSEDSSFGVEYSADGELIAQSIQGFTNHIRVTAQDGTSLLFDQAHDSEEIEFSLSPSGEVLFSKDYATGSPYAVLWSAREGRRLAEARYDAEDFVYDQISWNPDRLIMLVVEGDRGHVDAIKFDGTIARLGSLEFDINGAHSRTAMDRQTGRWIGVVEAGEVSAIEIGEHSISELRHLGRHDGTGIRVAFDPRGRFFASADGEGKIRLWDPTGSSPPTVLQGPAAITDLGVVGGGSLLEAHFLDDGDLRSWVWSLRTEDPQKLRNVDYGRFTGYGGLGWDPAGDMVARSGPDEKIRLRSMAAPADAEPLVLTRGDVGIQRGLSFHPSKPWLATADGSTLVMWPLGRRYPVVIRGHDEAVLSLAFDPEGRWIASGGVDMTVRMWPLDGEAPPRGRVLMEGDEEKGYRDIVRGLAVSPDGEQLLVGSNGQAVLVPLDGGPSKTLDGLPLSACLTFSADGRFAAGVGSGSTHAVCVWKVGTWEEVALLEPDKGLSFVNPHFLPDGRVLISSPSGLWVSDPATGKNDLLFEGIVYQFSVGADGRRVAMVKQDEWGFGGSGRVVILDLETGTTSTLESHGDVVWAVALDPTGVTIVTGDKDGAIRVGPVTGEEPHVLLGHEGRIWAVEVDPLGRWIASGGVDETVRLWPMPDLDKPPLHTLPHDELLAKLRTLTNLRVVRDEESSTGWKVEVGPFPGWAEVPEW